MDKERIVKEMRQLKQQGMSNSQIGKIYGVTKTHARSWIRKKKSERLTSDEIEK
jgi:transposase